jgi:hypothetical protein
MTYSPEVKKMFFQADPTTLNLGEYRVRGQSGTAAHRYNAYLPSDFKSLKKAVIWISIPPAVAGSGKDIDISSTYHKPGTTDVFNENSESDTTTVYDLTGWDNRTYELDVSGVLTSVTANTLVGVEVDNNSVGATTQTFGGYYEYYTEE